MTASNSKRILSISINRIDDPDPDTSYFGTYSDTQTSEFSIDRAHDEDCQTNSPTAKDAIDKLERVLAHLDKLRIAASDAVHDNADAEYAALVWAEDIVVDAQAKCAACDCGSGGTWDNREYRYFNPSSNYVDGSGNLRVGNTADEVRKYVAQDFDRMESLYAGNWSYIGIRAEASIVVNGTVQTVTSGGLYGIESDSGESYFAEVADEELGELRATLHQMGFSKRAVAVACKDLELVPA